MNDSIKRAIAPFGAGETPDLGADIAKASLQQREVMIDRVCQAILAQSGGLRAGEPG